MERFKGLAEERKLREKRKVNILQTINQQYSLRPIKNESRIGCDIF